MSDKNLVELILSAKNEKLINAFKQSERQIQSFGDKTVATGRRVGESMRLFSNSMMNGLAAIGVTYGFIEMSRDMMDFDGTLRRIGRTSGSSVKEIQELRQEIVGLIGPTAEIKVPLTKGEWANMALELNATGVQMNVIKDLLPQIGRGAVAANVDSKIYAATIGELLDKYKVLVKDMPVLQEQLNMALKYPDVRGHEERFLESLSGMSKTMRLIGAEGIQNFTPLAAIMAQLASEGADAQGSVEALMNGIFRLSKNRPKVAELKAHGIEFFNKGGGVKNIDELLPQIKKLSDAADKAGLDIDTVAMNLLGRPEAGKAMMILVKKFDEIKEKERQMKAASGGLGKDFETEADAMTNKLKTFQNQLDTFKVDHMTTVLKYLSNVLDQVNKHPAIVKGILGGLAVAGGAIILQKSISAIGGLINFGRDIGGIWAGKGKRGLPGGIAGPLGGGMTGPVPVYVVNKRMDLIDLPGGVKDPYKDMPGKIAKGVGGLGFLGTGAAVGAGLATASAVGISAYEIHRAMNSKPGDLDRMAGEGGMMGAATISKGLEKLFSNFFHKAEHPEVKNDIKLNISIDKDGRIIADTGNSGTNMTVKLLRGDFFA